MKKRIVSFNSSKRLSIQNEDSTFQLNRTILFLLLGLTLPFADISCAATGSKSDKILDRLQGEWLNKNYVTLLSNTKSPMRAATDSISAFKIVKDDSVYLWTQIFGFHESLTYEIAQLEPTRRSNTYRVNYNQENSNRRDSFVIENGKEFDEIKWAYEQDGNEKSFGFVKVASTIDEYINRTVLAGDYVDDKGRSFVFSQSNEAKWPHDLFKYEIILDYSDINCDCFTVLNDGEWQGYGFKWQDDKLLIFNLKGTETLECEPTPLWVLIPKERR